MELDKEQILADLKDKGSKSPDHKYSWQVLATEMTKKFGTQMFWLFYKYPEAKIRDAYAKCHKEGTYKVNYLVENIKNLW